MTIQRAPLLGVSGETGVSLGCGTMYGLDGLKTGGGGGGGLFTIGGGAAGAGFVPCAWGAEFVPCACACSIAPHAPKTAAQTASKSVAGVIRAKLLVCIALSFEPICTFKPS